MPVRDLRARRATARRRTGRRAGAPSAWARRSPPASGSGTRRRGASPAASARPTPSARRATTCRAGRTRRRRRSSTSSWAIEGGLGLTKKSDVDAAKKRMLVGWSTHFYLATDIKGMKLLTQGGAPRFAEPHEMLHLILERAEKAYDDFVAVWGEEAGLGRPHGHLPRRARRRSRPRGRWPTSAARRPTCSSAAGRGRSAGGFCANGFATSLDDDDRRPRPARVRPPHDRPHPLLVLAQVSRRHQEVPEVGVRRRRRLAVQDRPAVRRLHRRSARTRPRVRRARGRTGTRRRARIAADASTIPIEKLFTIASQSHLSYDDLVRSWSYMDVMLREDRERWLATLQGIREGQGARASPSRRASG